MLKRNPIQLSVALLGLAMSGSALAADWGDFEDSFSASPCPDGWLGCVIDGEQVNSGLMEQGGVPTPANMRISWFDLKPTPTFSPFTSLSDYSGIEVTVKEDDEPPPEVKEPVASNTPSEPSGTISSGGSRPDSSGSSASSGSSSAGSSGTTLSSGGSRPDSESSSASSSSSGTSESTTSGGGSRPDSSGSATVDSSGSAGTTIGSGGSRPTETEKPTVEKPTSTARVDAAGDDSCDNVKALEPKAMLGKLSKGQEECLEGRLEGTTVMTDKDKISRVLMANAYSSRNLAKWERLIKRHLDEIDRSDPNLSYKYAQYLKKQGVGRAPGALRWADVALEQKHLWSGPTYVNRVYALYKLKAQVSQSLWMAAEQKHQTAPTPDTQKAVENAKNKTKVAARDWYDYAKEAKKDTTVALQLCSSAAGTKEYCQGG